MVDQHSLFQTQFKGAERTCPRCGAGQLFSGYLRRVDACPHCHESFLGLDADDGPAWLTIVLSLHAFGPVFMLLDQQTWLSAPVEAMLGLTIMTTLVFFLLPRAKGLFIAHMWWLERRPMPDESSAMPALARSVEVAS